MIMQNCMISIHVWFSFCQREKTDNKFVLFLNRNRCYAQFCRRTVERYYATVALLWSDISASLFHCYFHYTDLQNIRLINGTSETELNWGFRGKQDILFNNDIAEGKIYVIANQKFDTGIKITTFCSFAAITT